jgi:hypothetical protein
MIIYNIIPVIEINIPIEECPLYVISADIAIEPINIAKEIIKVDRRRIIALMC